MSMRDWTVLVVEDEPDGQTVVAGILSYFHIRVEAVGTAEEAVKALAARAFNAVVIDLMLPGMNGLTLVQSIRENSTISALPCVAITAYHSSAVKEQALDCGFDGYFSKPLDDTAFVRELSRLIEGK
jgi:CheY-like chemotaxis protein